MKIQVLLATVVLVGGSAFAQAPAPVAAPKDPTATPRVDARQAKQEKRIEQGVASGQLTPQETKRLEKGEARIDKAEDRAKADGVVTKQERHRLADMQNHESRAIAREKHDKQRDLNHDGKRDRHPAGRPNGKQH
jgi:TolA-binding protein